MISSLLYSQEAKAEEEKPTPAKQPKATEKPKKKTMEEALKNTIEKAGGSKKNGDEGCWHGICRSVPVNASLRAVV